MDRQQEGSIWGAGGAVSEDTSWACACTWGLAAQCVALPAAQLTGTAWDQQPQQMQFIKCWPHTLRPLWPPSREPRGAPLCRRGAGGPGASHTRRKRRGWRCSV